MLKRLELIFKTLFVGTFGLFLRKGRANPGTINLKRVRKILIIRPEKIGDLFIALPLADRIKKAAPHIKISVLTSDDAAVLIREDPRFDKIFIYRKNFQHDMENLFAMRDENYDVVFDLVGRDSVLSLISGQLVSRRAYRITIGKNEHKKYFDYVFDLRRNNTGHVIANTMRALEAFDLKYTEEDCYVSPFLSEKSKTKAQEYFKSIGGDRSLLGYNISAGGDGRTWPFHKSEELLEKIRESYKDCEIILLCTPADRDKAMQIKNSLTFRVEIIPDNLSLSDVSAIIRGLDCLITPDTSLVHIARSFRVPVVAIYARNLDNYKIWKPFGQGHGQVISDDNNNIEKVAVDRVVDEFNLVMREYGGRKNAEAVGDNNYQQ